MRFRILAVDVSRIAICLCLAGTALKAQTNIESRPESDKTEAVDMTATMPNRVDKASLPFTTDTQVRLMGLFEPTGTNSPILLPVATETNESPYFAIEGVPLRSVFKLLARSSGLNYLEPEADQIPDEEITL